VQHSKNECEITVDLTENTSQDGGCENAIPDKEKSKSGESIKAEDS